MTKEIETIVDERLSAIILPRLSRGCERYTHDQFISILSQSLNAIDESYNESTRLLVEDRVKIFMQSYLNIMPIMKLMKCLQWCNVCAFWEINYYAVHYIELCQGFYM